jgi:metal-sulfur cluster biosynthetic enzyme
MAVPARVEQVRDALRGVYDPELGIDIVAMGLVYDVREEGGRVVVDMTLTTPGCPVSESLPDAAWSAAIDALGPGGVTAVEVRLVWDPPWTPERLSPDALAALGMSPR